eukprot:TRINITY_DN6246_c1_g1_i2.p1 TRINITY_DN6246_c1_g1~~TRINITY_DN6246_c1_g1_i2.p1  ORF type:complete len:132 (+),score=21.99 TRINITY_DN6246_c1_g1_i2:46-396(+)
MEEKKKVSVMVDGSRDVDDKPFDFTEFQDEFYIEPSGPYQTRKTSIVNGMSTDRLIDEHRKSIAHLNEGAGNAVGVETLSGVTLSRRHTLSAEEYSGGLEEDRYDALRGYAFTGDE